MIKYLGSKRRLAPVLGQMLSAAGAATALDLFTGSTRVAQEFKRRGARVTAVDTARYAEVLARTAVETDSEEVDRRDLADALGHLDSLPGRPGYFTETFCLRSRFFQPANGARIDVVRETLDRDYRGSPLFPLLLASLIQAADRVDSTTGVHMAYVKEWSPRSFRPLQLRPPQLLPGPGRAVRGDACRVAGRLGEFDFAYLDPPYNQHRYLANYHIWETLVAWDAPAHYGVACKRADSRDAATRTAFDRRREMPAALGRVVADVPAGVVVLSYNDEAWVGLPELVEMCSAKGHVEVLAFPSRRYVGARIGIHNARGEKVGTVSHVTNREYLVVAGDRRVVRRVAAAGRVAGGRSGWPTGRDRTAVGPGGKERST